MGFNISTFKSQLALGGARPSLYQVVINNPVNNNAYAKIPFMVRATAIPASTLTEIPVSYFGRQIKLAGTRTFADWEVTVINDEDFLIRDTLEQWSFAINLPDSNIQTFGTASPSQYKSTAQITQMSKTGIPIRTYNVVGIWPINVAAIPLDWANGDQVEEFNVTFAVDEVYPIAPTTTGTAGGQI